MDGLVAHLVTRNTHKRQTFIATGRIRARNRPQTVVLDRWATGIGSADIKKR